MAKLSIKEELCYSTTRIETTNTGGSVFSGTGFFFNLEIGSSVVFPLVVTNKHVVRGMSSGSFVMTESDDNGNPIHTNHISIKLDNFENQWIFHPDDKVDLCVLPFNRIIELAKNNGKTLFYKSLYNSLIPSKSEIENLDAVEDIIMIGYPNGLWDSVNNLPLIRKGITATDVKFDYEGRKDFLIDAACFPGSSGSPVMICNIGSYTDKNGAGFLGRSRTFLLGVLYAGPQLTVEGEIKIVTVPSAQTKQMSISRIPNNLGYVIKAERLLDFIPVIKQKYNL